MIGFVADPERVDYWTSYMDYGTLDEFKKTRFWDELSEKQKENAEWWAANAKVVREQFKEKEKAWTLEHSQVKEKEQA